MATRDQLTEERLNALIELLVDEGVINRDWADSLEQTRDFGDAAETAQAKRDGASPPSHAGTTEVPGSPENNNGGNS